MGCTGCGALGTMQYDVGRGVFRRGGHGGGVFDSSISGLGVLGQLTPDLLSWGGGGGATTWGTEEEELQKLATPPPLPPSTAPATTTVTAAPKPAATTTYRPATTVAPSAALPVYPQQRAGMSDKTLAMLIGGGVALAAVYYLYKKGKL